MKKIWTGAELEMLDVKATAHGVQAPFVEDGDKWTCSGTVEDPCEAGHTAPGLHGTWGSAEDVMS